MVDVGTSSSGGELTLDPPAPVRRSRRTALWGALAAVAVAAGALAVTSGGGSDDLPQLPVTLGADGGGVGREAAMSADLSMAAWITYVAGEGLPALGGEAPAYRASGAIDESAMRGLADAFGLDGEITHRDGLWEVRDGDAVLSAYDGSGGVWSYWVEQAPLDGGSGSTGSSSGSSTGGCADGATTCTTIVTEPADTPVADCEPGTKCVDVVTPTTSVCPPDAMCTLPVEECPPNAGCSAPEPVEPTPPADLPSEDEARRIALDLLAATGIDVADAEVTVDGPYDAWYVNVEPVMDGTPVSGWSASVSVGSKGDILNASGTLTGAERLGDYPVLDTTAAIDRLNEQQGQWRPYPMAEDLSARSGAASASGSSADGIASGDAASSAPAAGTSQSETAVTSVERVDPACKEQPDGREICEPVTTVPGECVPIVPDQTPDGEVPAIAQCAEPSPQIPEPQPMPEPEPIEVVLSEAERILVALPAMDDSGDIYLVPGYRFGADDGTSVDVAAVDDESLAPTTTVDQRTVPPEPVPMPAPACEILTEDDGSGTTHTVQSCPAEIPPSDPELRHLSEGETPELGVPYYVDGVNAHCGMFTWAGRWWATAEQTPLAGWDSSEGGTFTLATPDEGTFVGDAAGTKLAVFTARGPVAETPGCA